MSSSVFPTLPGMTFDIKKRPQFSTIIQRTASGKEIRSALMSYPLWQFEIGFDVLRSSAAYAEFQTLAGFFLQMMGNYDTFLFNDTSDNSVTAQLFGTGDASTISFQLVRALGGFTEPIQNVNGAPAIYVSGVLKTLTTDYTISSAGVITFVSAPASGALLTWTGGFYYRCRFDMDVAEFNNFMSGLWDMGKCAFVSVKQ